MARDRGRQAERKPANDDRLLELYSTLAAQGITGQAAIDAVAETLEKEKNDGHGQ